MQTAPVPSEIEARLLILITMPSCPHAAANRGNNASDTAFNEQISKNEAIDGAHAHLCATGTPASKLRFKGGTCIACAVAVAPVLLPQAMAESLKTFTYSVAGIPVVICHRDLNVQEEDAPDIDPCFFDSGYSLAATTGFARARHAWNHAQPSLCSIKLRIALENIAARSTCR